MIWVVSEKACVDCGSKGVGILPLLKDEVRGCSKAGLLARVSTRCISLYLCRSRPYPLKKPFPLGNEEGELLNLQIVFLVTSKLKKKFLERLKTLFAPVGKVQLWWETIGKPFSEEWFGDGKIEFKRLGCLGSRATHQSFSIRCYALSFHF